MKGFILYPTYRIVDGKAYVHLYGKLENGETFQTINYLRPYFYIRKNDLKQAQGIKDIEKFDDEESGFKTFRGDDTVKIILDVPGHVPDLRKSFEDQGIECYEADIRFAYRFMMDLDLKGSLEIEGEFEKDEYVDRLYNKPKLKPASFIPKLKIASIDIETDSEAMDIYSISIYSGDFQKAFIISDKKLKNAVSCKDEEELLNKFKEQYLKIDPDIVVGWNLIDFDLAKLQEKFKIYKIDFNLGRSPEKSKLRIVTDFFRDSKANFIGRMVLDGIHLLKTSFIKLDDYKLDTAAQEFLGEKKLISSNRKGAEIEELFMENPQKLVDYNLKDAELVYKILEKIGVLNLTIQRSLLTGMPLDRVKASIASLDSLYLRELKQLKLVAPSAKFNEREERIKGGYVMKSTPGIYDFIVVCDFKSLYPSIIRTFNIDPYSYVPNKKGKDLVKAPNGANFRNEDGILPMLIQKLWDARDKARKDKNELARYAIKILMNSFFGVLANPNCRFYSNDIANAITHFGQYILKTTAEKVEDDGYEVIYGDTDSIFIKTEAANTEDAEKIGQKLQKKINAFFEEMVKKDYKRDNFMELEFEKTFIRFLMPKVRGSEVGSKKRYAGLLLDDKGNEKIDFTGLEFVRRDWTEVSKKFQMALLDKIFHKQEVAKYIKDFVDKLKDGKFDDLLIYRKALRKDLDAYTKTTPPHVKAARLLDKIESNIIEYYLTVEGPEPLQKLTHQIDYEHYIEKQIKPIADAVLCFYNQNFDDIIMNSTQTNLFNY